MIDYINNDFYTECEEKLDHSQFQAAEQAGLMVGNPEDQAPALDVNKPAIVGILTFMSWINFIS